MVPHPLLLGATSTLQSFLGDGETLDAIGVDDIKASLRQQIRYHCRLSHMAAHTALWSIDLESLAGTPQETLIEQIQDFMGIHSQDIAKELRDDTARHESTFPPEVGSQLPTISTRSNSILSHIQLSLQQDILKEMDQVLLHELKISKNLSAWPCESFWTVGENLNNTKLSPIVSRISRAMSPNCSAPFTTCFVKRDFCEEKGDGKCKD